MADEDESEEPAVTLGEGEQVDGAPLARVAARLMWGIEKSKIVEREGETTVRTPDGPRELGDVLAAVDQPYFATRREFVDAVEGVIGTGPIPTAEPSPDDTAESDEAAGDEVDEEDADGDEEEAEDDEEEADGDGTGDGETDEETEDEEADSEKADDGDNGEADADDGEETDEGDADDGGDAEEADADEDEETGEE